MGQVSDEELPNFLVIVGRNGSGKTHLLEAISSGACQVEPVVPTRPVPQQAHPYEFNRYGPQRRAFPPPQPTRYVAFGGFKDFPRSVVTQMLTIASIELFATNVDTLKAQYADANDLKIAVETSGFATKAAMDEMERVAGKSIIDMTEEELKAHAPPVLGVHDPFNVALADLFVDFRARREELDQANYRWERGRSTTRPMSLEDFDAQFRPPWDVVNLILAETDFPFRVDPPGSLVTGQYSASFTDVDSGAVVSFEALSAGEKVLIALVLLEYTAASEVAVWRFPSLVLLDEPDVGLHPALVERLVNVLESVLVQSHDVRVIITTHSPVTASIVPETSLYEMRRSAMPRLVKRERTDALASLTLGMPYLSISTERQRHVIVEGDLDAKVYAEMFRFLRRKIDRRISLEFIWSGVAIKKGDMGGGKSNVAHLVDRFRSAGNRNVVGIIDWDLEHVPDPGRGIFVPSGRYSLENFIYDPVIVGYLLLHEGIRSSQQFGIEDLRVIGIDSSHAQRLADGVIRALYPDSGTLPLETVSCHYYGEFDVSLPVSYLRMYGHDLADAIKGAFPELKRFHNKHELEMRLVKLGFANKPEFLPQPLADVLVAIATSA